MTFFYDLNKRLATLAAKQDATQIAESKQADHVAQSPLTQALNEGQAKRLPGLPIAKKDVEKKFGGSAVKMAKAAKEAGFSDARIRQAMDDLYQGKNPNDIDEADTIYVQHSNGAPQKVKLTPDMKAAGKIYVQHPSGPQTKVKIPADAKKSVKEEDVAEAGYSAKAGRAGKDLGKPGKNFSKIAKGAAERYGSKEAGERVAGAVLNKLRHPKESIGQADEGNAFTGKLKATPKGEKFKLGDKEFKDTSDLEEGFKEMDAWLASREKEKGTGKFDKRTTSTGTVYTRKPETFDDPETDPEATGGAPKRRGRPKGKDKGPERVTAKSYKYKAGRPQKTAEDLDSDGVMMTRPTNCSSESVEPGDRGEYDQEGESAKHDIKTIVRHAQALHKILGDDDNLPEWVQSKLAKIEGMMIAVDEYMQNQDQEVSEKAPPGAKAERMVKGIKKSLSKDGHLSNKDKAIAYATTWKAKKAGQVEEAGKPDFLDLDKDGDKKEPMKKAAKEKKVDETTVAGSVATAPATTKKSSGGMQYGKGVYEGFNNSVEKMINESIEVADTIAENQGKTITVTASGPEADMLMQLLKAAGLSGQSSGCGCGQTPCACDQTVDEAYGDTDETLNNPDWPTDTETLEAEPNLRTYSGGLNGPKSTGQTTIPVVASQERRLHSESVELERNLFKTWKNYKG